MKLFFSYIRQHKMSILAFVLFCLIFIVSFCLYHLPVEAVAYPAALCVLTGAVLFAVDYRRACANHRELKSMKQLSAPLIDTLPRTDSIEGQDYQQLIKLLCDERRQLETYMNSKYRDMVDYYTVWAHQIKTPIASMRLSLQNEDSDLSRKLSTDLFRIEQYAQMVMMFLRLDSEATDYVIRQCDLDAVVKQAVRKFSGEFILRRISLEYEPIDEQVITDEKWLSFVIEQILSNALKYTQKGRITIKMEPPKTLCVCDSGIGIAPEDIPRIFEKGYTGYNGRSDKRASGIGLYLCRRICKNLGHGIEAESTLGAGTVIKIDLSQTVLKTE